MVLADGGIELGTKTSAGAAASAEGMPGAGRPSFKRAPSHGCSQKASVSCCLLAGGLSFSPHGSLHGTC